jgi:PBP4 family serine-type D-alanyl-D-alanine carboxypeptidase
MTKLSISSAIQLIPNTGRVFIHGAAATPSALLAELVNQAPRFDQLELMHLHTIGSADYAHPKYAKNFRVTSFFVGSNLRKAMDFNRIDYLPCFLSEIPIILRKGPKKPDAVLIHVSPPDRHGYCTLGTSVDVVRAAIDAAEIVIAQVNPQMPRIHGDGLLHISEIDAMVDVDLPIPESLLPNLTAEEELIGRHVASLVEDEATLQMGIGSIPNAVLKFLTNHKNLGMHTEMWSDGALDLIEKGVINNSKKKIHPHKSVSSFLFGTKRLYDFVADNPSVIQLEVSYVNNPTVIARNRKVTAINSAVEVDLTGQVCADSVGHHVISGVGGQIDFIRGASLSEKGKPIIAMTSRSNKGIPRIVAELKSGAGVVTTRAHIHYIVTEYGVADLFGKSISERVKALTNIAHPDDREKIDQDWRHCLLSFLFLFTFAFTFTFQSLVYASPATATVKKIIETHAKKNHIAMGDLGIIFSSSKNHSEPIYENNSTKKYIPASLTKVFTAATVLNKIPSGTKLKTKLASSANIENQKLKGDLYLVGGGDPGFVSETMWFLVNAFTRQHIKEIEGDLVVDSSLFDKAWFDESRQEQREDRAFDAPVSGMAFNWNSVNVFLKPGSKIGNSAQVTVDPENGFVVLKSNLKTGKNTDYSVERKFDDSLKKDVIYVSGTIAIHANEIAVYKGISNPDLWVGENLRSFLLQRGISVNGKVRSGVSPQDSTLLADADSHPIEYLVMDMNKFSSNYVAEMLTKNIAALQSPPGSIEKGVKVIQEFIKSTGVSSNDFEIYNPSGFTRDNRCTPKALHTVLEKVRTDIRVFPEFIASLPIAGVDGTLKKRMKNTPAEQWVRAKTGLLHGVTGIAGFAGRAGGEILTFVMIYNGSLDGGTVRNTFDRILADILSDSQ